MSDIEWCKTCGGIIWHDMKYQPPHVCPPLFEVWCPEEDGKPEFANKVRARDHEEAAEKWAEQDDDYDTPRIAMEDWTPVVCVRKLDDDTVKRFKVTGEFVREYRAEEATESESTDAPHEE